MRLILVRALSLLGRFRTEGRGRTSFGYSSELSSSVGKFSDSMGERTQTEENLYAISPDSGRSLSGTVIASTALIRIFELPDGT